MTLGILVVAPYGRVQFRYAFTPADVVWLGRLLAAASSGRYPVRPRALLWKALTRFGASGRNGLSLAAFIQRLEPSLPRVPWGQLAPAVRQLAFAAGTGALRRRNPNAPVSVMPRGGAAGPGGYGYGRSPAAGGWAGESEQFETTPAESPDATPVTATDPAAPPASAPPDAATEEPAPAEPDDAADLSAGGGGTEPPMAAEPPPPPAAFNTQDGNRLVLNSQLLRRLMRAYRRRHPTWGVPFGAPGFGAQPAAYRYPTPYGASPYVRAPYGGYPRWRPAVTGAGFVRPWAGQAATGLPLAARRALVGRMQRLAQQARRVGTLRSVRSGRRYPVFGGQVGGKNYRIVTRPRRGMQHEIMLVRGGALQQELAG